MKLKTIEERLRDIADSSLNPSKYSPDESLSTIDKWISEQKEFSKQKKIYKYFSFIESTGSVLNRTFREKIYEQYQKAKQISQKIISLENLDVEEIKASCLEIEINIEKINESIKLFYPLCKYYLSGFSVPHFIEENLIQFPEIAEERIKRNFLNKSSKELSNCLSVSNLYDYYLFKKYAEYHEKLTERVIEKIGEIYIFDKNERENNGKKITHISLGAGLPSLVADCVFCINDLGKKIGFNEEKSYSLAKITKEEIEEDKDIVREQLKHLKLFDSNLGVYY